MSRFGHGSTKCLLRLDNNRELKIAIYSVFSWETNFELSTALKFSTRRQKTEKWVPVKMVDILPGFLFMCIFYQISLYRQFNDKWMNEWILGFIVRTTTKVIFRPRFRSFTWRHGDSNEFWGLSSGQLQRSYPDPAFAASPGGSGIRTWDLLVVGRVLYH